MMEKNIVNLNEGPAMLPCRTRRRHSLAGWWGGALVAGSLALLVSCGAGKEAPDATGGAPAPAASGNFLSMQINGTPWVADAEIFGAVHPPAMRQAIMIAGAKGGKDASEQAFNLNLYQAPGPGDYEIQHGSAGNGVVQLGNLSPEHYLYGSMLGYKLKVHVTKASTSPTEIEATFTGEMTGNAGDVLKVTEGKFYYRE